MTYHLSKAAYYKHVGTEGGNEGEHWITTSSGAHILIGKEGPKVDEGKHATSRGRLLQMDNKGSISQRIQDSAKTYSAKEGTPPTHAFVNPKELGAKTESEALPHIVNGIHVSAKSSVMPGMVYLIAKNEQKAISQAERDAIPAEDFVDPQGRRFYVRNAQDVKDAVSSYGRAKPQIPFERFKERLTAIARRKGLESALPQEWKEEKAKHFDADYDSEWGDLLDNRATYAQDEELPEWEKAAGPLPHAWLRAHPYGSPRDKDGQGNYFDQRTNFHDELLKAIPVSYYHNWSEAGVPSGDPIAVGKTVARKYAGDGRWDKVTFLDDIPDDIKAEIRQAMEDGTLRSSPTVVPDFHVVEDDGHIKDWLTGSIAVFRADGEHQPASPKAIGIPTMKALYKSAGIRFPNLEARRMKGQKASRMKAARRHFDGMMKALFAGADNEPDGDEEGEQIEHEHPEAGIVHAHARGDEEHSHDEETQKAVFKNDRMEENANRSRFAAGNWTQEFEGPQGFRDRFDGALPEAAMKAEEEDPELRLVKSRLKATEGQMKALITNSQRSEAQAYVLSQIYAGKLMPAEGAETVELLMQAMNDDARPSQMKADGKPVSRVAAIKKFIESQPGRLGSSQLTNAQMKALNFEYAPFLAETPKERDENAPPSEERHKQLLEATDLGAQALAAKRTQA